MLGQLKEHTVSGWGIILVILAACLLLVLMAAPLFVRTVSAQTLTPPSVEVLRAAKPDLTGGAVPESTMVEQMVSVEVLRAAKPDTAGGFVPESTIGEPVVSLEVLRAAKPDFTGGHVPESNIGEQR